MEQGLLDNGYCAAQLDRKPKQRVPSGGAVMWDKGWFHRTGEKRSEEKKEVVVSEERGGESEHVDLACDFALGVLRSRVFSARCVPLDHTVDAMSKHAPSLEPLFSCSFLRRRCSVPSASLLSLPSRLLSLLAVHHRPPPSATHHASALYISHSHTHTCILSFTHRHTHTLCSLPQLLHLRPQHSCLWAFGASTVERAFP